MKIHFLSFLLFLYTLVSPGCLTIEKKSLVMLIPPASKEVHLYYVFEGISVLEHEKSELTKAKKELDGLRHPDFSFFLPGLAGGDSPLRKYCRFEEPRFFTNPERKRPLCLDRRITITDCDAFARELNLGLSQVLWRSLQDYEAKDLRADIKKANQPAELEKSRASIDGLGLGPLGKTMMGLVTLANEYDLDSLELIRKAAADDKTRWLTFADDAVLLRLPATAECAGRIAKSPKAKDWLKETSEFVRPIDLKADADGLLIVLGKKGEPIRFAHEDRRPHRPADEKALQEHLGMPGPILIDDRPANAERLIDEYLAEKKRKK